MFVANLRTFWWTFYRPKKSVGVQKMTNIRYWVAELGFGRALYMQARRRARRRQWVDPGWQSLCHISRFGRGKQQQGGRLQMSLGMVEPIGTELGLEETLLRGS